MESYVTLAEIYIFDAKLFKTKNLKSFIKNHKIQEIDIIKLKNSKLAIKQTWLKKNLPSFNLKLTEINEIQLSSFFEVQSILEKYKCKIFNPVNFNLDSTMVKYFIKDGKRTPYFNKKGLIKIMIHYNDLNENIFNWITELHNGSLQTEINNLNNIIEIVNLKHVPVIKNINGNMVLSECYSLSMEDVIVDFKRVDSLKKEPNLNHVIEQYKCPLYTQLQANYQKGLEEAERRFNDRVKELKQEKIIQHLEQELDKEKKLKDQMFSLTQSFVPRYPSGGYNDDASKRLLYTSPSNSLTKDETSSTRRRAIIGGGSDSFVKGEAAAAMPSFHSSPFEQVAKLKPSKIL
jgi:hypothetical protein